MSRLKSFFESIAELWIRQLPLFVMLVIYTTAPTFFSCPYSYKTYLLMVLPQVVLPSLLLCMFASWRRWAWWLVFIFASFMWMTELGCYFCQHQRLWSKLALIIAQSDAEESTEYLSEMYINVMKTLAVSALSFITVYVCDRYWRKYSVTLINRLHHSGPGMIISRIAGCILALSVVYSPITTYSYSIKDKPYWIRTFKLDRLQYVNTWVMYAFVLNDTFNNPDFNKIHILADTIASADVTYDGGRDSLTVVYVIGESFTRNRSSLYGYPYETNPLMAKELADSTLVIFDNIISMSHYTADVYKHLISTCDIEKRDSFEYHPLLPALAKKSGYKVAYLDNQISLDNKIGDVKCTYFFSNNKVKDYCIDMHNNDIEQYDIDIVNRYGIPFGESGEKKFVIYHLKGQHFTYASNYPESFRHKHPDVMPALRRNTHKAIYNTDLPHTILDIIDIQTKTFNPDLSLLRDGGGRKHRHVWMHDTDYDAMRDEIYRRKLRYEQ